MRKHGLDEVEADDAIVLMPGHELVTCCVFAGAQRGYVDGPIADARFHGPTALLQLSDGGLLVSDRHRLRKISADDVRQQVSTIAGGHLCVLDGFEARLTKRRRTCVTDT